MKDTSHLHRLVNISEENAYEELLRSTSIAHSEIFTKIRIADVIKVSNDKLNSDEYSFALKAHFDFVITNENKIPLFVVEFDGPSHSSPYQKNIDKRKMRICEKYNLPILRIKETHITRNYRGKMSLLYWIVEVYYTQIAFDDAQGKGYIPLDECFDPLSIISDGNIPSNIWPYQLGYNDRLKLIELEKNNQTIESVASGFMGYDKKNTLKGCKLIRLNEKFCIYAETAMRHQNFPVFLPDLFEELLMTTLIEQIDVYLQNGTGAILLLEAKAKIKVLFENTNRISTCSTGDLTDFFENLSNSQ